MAPVFSCPVCNALNAIGNGFCENCGEKFEYRCVHCGGIIRSGYKFCEHCGVKLIQEVNQIKQKSVDGEEADDKRHDIDSDEQADNKSAPGLIEKYDKELLNDIDQIKDSISIAEEEQKKYMRDQGAREEVIESVVKEARDNGKPVSLNYSGGWKAEIKEWLESVSAIYKDFPFRLFENRYKPEFRVIKGDSIFFFDTCLLNDEELQEFVKYRIDVGMLNKKSELTGIWRLYPSQEFMKFMGLMLEKYGIEDLLKVEECFDERQEERFKLEKKRVRENNKL